MSNCIYIDHLFNPFSRMAFPTLINWRSPFPFYGLFGGTFILIQILIEHSVNPYHAKRSVAPDLGLLCLPML